MSEVKNGNGKALYISMIIILLGLNAWLFYNAQQNKKASVEYQAQLSEVENLNKEMEVSFNSLMNELNSRKGNNAEKDSVINLLESELLEKRNKINTLLNSGTTSTPATSKQLNEAKERIAKLESDLAFYLTKINEYTDQYNNLLDEYNILKSKFDDQVARNEMLQTEMDSILTIGSIIMAADISVVPVQTKGSDDKEANKAKKTDRLKINFDLVPNMLSAGRNQVFYLKLIDPNNVTMKSAENMGGDYSAIVNVDYNGQTKETHTVYWDQNYTFLPGKYQVEMFHNGFSIGSESFILK